MSGELSARVSPPFGNELLRGLGPDVLEPVGEVGNDARGMGQQMLGACNRSRRPPSRARSPSIVAATATAVSPVSSRNSATRVSRRSWKSSVAPSIAVPSDRWRNYFGYVAGRAALSERLALYFDERWSGRSGPPLTLTSVRVVTIYEALGRRDAHGQTRDPFCPGDRAGVAWRR